MTARLGTHPDVASRTSDVLDRLIAAGVDVEAVGADVGVSRDRYDPLRGVRDSTLDLALVGIHGLRGSDDLTTVAVLPREEPRDVLVSFTGAPAPLAALAAGARVGVTGSRRLAFLRAHRPDVEAVRYGDDTSLLAAGQRGDVEAAVLGSIEVRQARLLARIGEALDAKSWLPEPGKGALALVARHPIAEATALDHLPTRTALRTELALLEALGAPVDAPLGALAQPSGRWIRLWAAAVSPDGRRLVRSDLTGPLDEPEALGAAVARQLTARGVGLILSHVSGAVE